MERERFLDAVAARLGRSRQRAAPERPLVTPPDRSVPGSLLERFTVELSRVGGTVSQARTLDEVQAELSMAIDAAGALPTVAFSRSEFEAFGLKVTAPPFERVCFFSDSKNGGATAFRRVALKAALGITTAACAVASSGTILLASSETAPRSVSLLPRRHLVLLHEHQIKGNLGEVLSWGAPGQPSETLPSALLFITGPSRTSDIENDLSIGVHGPAEVHVLIYTGRTS